MATNNAPKHDFAPAWLKIPTQETTKQSGGSKPFDNEKSNRPRSHKDDSFFNKRHQLSSGKYRHHSVEDDYYNAYPPYGPYGYYNGYGMPYNSQPSIYRSPSRDGKYPPNMRFGQLNGGYPGYYDLYSFDYYHGDHSYYGNYPNNRVNNKRGNYERDGRTNSKEKEDKAKGKDEEKDKPPFQEEFPSLNGEEKSEATTNGKLTNGSSVWEHPPHGKGSSNKLSENRQAANIYKTLVPNKQSAVTRKPGKEGLRLNGSLQKDTFSSVKTMSPTNTKEQTPTSPIEILNTRFQPRNLGNKKSEFLKALRKENNGSDKHENTSKDDWDLKNDHTDQLSNGVEGLAMDDTSNMLSSSLEAEQRLLKEMGWNETDQEEYEITEDDKKMFQDLYSKQQNRSTRLNKTFSPKHIPIYQPNAQDLNDTLSSSDSDSDGQ